MGSVTLIQGMLEVTHMKWDCNQAVMALVWPLQWVTRYPLEVQLSAQKELAHVKGQMTVKMLSSQGHQN